MSRTIKDDELRAYSERIGAKQYRALYIYELNKAKRQARNDIRQSRKNYVNSKEKLYAIKEKYKDGVTQEIIEEWLKKMIEVDLNNGMFRKIDLNKTVYCVKCKKEIVRDGNSINLNINVHTCGYAFCKECKKKLNEFAGEKLVDYERKLVEEFIKE